MRRSDGKILTTHVGSLPFLSLERGVARGDETHLADDVAAIVARQRDIGIDVINEGEYSKGGDWLRYMQSASAALPILNAASKAADRTGQRSRGIRRILPDMPPSAARCFICPGAQIAKKAPGPGLHRTHHLHRRSRAQEGNRRHARGRRQRECFSDLDRAGSLEVYRRNRYYRGDEEYVFAIADAMRVEYEAIAAPALILRSTTPGCRRCGTASAWPWGSRRFRRRCEMRIEALNHALRNIPEDRVRYHLCWGSWHGPHAYDHRIERIVDMC